MRYVKKPMTRLQDIEGKVVVVSHISKSLGPSTYKKHTIEIAIGDGEVLPKLGGNSGPTKPVKVFSGDEYSIYRYVFNVDSGD